jgi:cytochrome c-type biogenesis protein CcmH
MIQFLRTILFAIAMLVTNQSAAWEPNEVLADSALESRAREISAQLRCLVCQNQSIEDSSADLAKDLRLLVRERLTAGDSNDEIFSFLVARYGDFILLKPKLAMNTLLLWGLPLFLLIIGALIIFRSVRKQTISNQNNELSGIEKANIAQILDEQ